MDNCELLSHSSKYGMTFKDWIISERVAENGQSAGGPEAASRFTGGTFGGSMWDLLYPTSPADFAWASAYPEEFFWLKWKFDRGEELGRKLYNVDNKEFQKRFFTTLESPTAPDGGDGFWKHKDAPSTKVVKNVDLVWIGDGKTSKDTKPIEGYNFNNPFGGVDDLWPWYPDREKYLEKIFGDRATLKWPELSKNFDEPWTKKYESYMTQYSEMATAMHGGIQDLPGSNINNNMPVRSKISATDQVKEPPDMEETPEKMFGFKQWLDKKRARESGQKDIHKKRQGSPMRVPRVYT